MAIKATQTANVSEGKASVDYTIPGNVSVGDYKLKATYQENDTYSEGMGINDFNVRQATTISVSNVIGSKGETITLSAQVNNDTAVLISEGTVQFKIDDINVGSSANVTNGVATITYTVPENRETNGVITASYSGTSTYGVSSTTTNGVLTLRQGVTVHVPSQNILVNRSESATVSGTVTKDTENVPNGVIKFACEEIELEGTVSDGAFSFTFDVPEAWNYGTHTYTINYLQNDVYDPANAGGQLSVRQRPNLTNVNVSGDVGEEITLTCNVFQEDNKTPIVGGGEGEVKFTIDGTTSTVSVDATGKAVCTFTVPSTAVEGSTYNFTTEYLQSNNYEYCKCSVDGVVTVRKSVTVTVTPITANVGDKVTLEASVLNGEANVTSGEVVFTIESDE